MKTHTIFSENLPFSEVAWNYPDTIHKKSPASVSCHKYSSPVISY